jgi:hypothetical protein
MLFFVPEIIKFYELHIERAKKRKTMGRERKRIVCAWHMELLVVDTRRQAGSSSYRLINGLIFRLDYNC